MSMKIREMLSKEKAVAGAMSELNKYSIRLIMQSALLGLGSDTDIVSVLGTEVEFHITDDPDTSTYKVIPPVESGIEPKLFKAEEVDEFNDYVKASEEWGYDHEDIVQKYVVKAEMEEAKRKEMEV